MDGSEANQYQTWIMHNIKKKNTRGESVGTAGKK